MGQKVNLQCCILKHIYNVRYTTILCVQTFCQVSKKVLVGALLQKKKGYPLLLKITKFQNMVNKKNIGDFCNVRCKAVTV